jgi:DNA-binding MarR family transcriptional regulator
MAELAERLLFTRSGVTRLVDRLERDGFVERNECPDDGRGVYAILTAKGFATFEAAAPPFVDGIRNMFFDRLDGKRDTFDEILSGLAPDEKSAERPA